MKARAWSRVVTMAPFDGGGYCRSYCSGDFAGRHGYPSVHVDVVAGRAAGADDDEEPCLPELDQLAGRRGPRRPGQCLVLARVHSAFESARPGVEQDLEDLALAGVEFLVGMCRPERGL